MTPSASPADAKLWFAIRVKSNREKITATAVRGLGHEEFSPMQGRGKLVPGRPKVADLPLFPGYIFGRFALKDRLPILMLPGVLHLVGVGREPLPVDSREIDSIRLMIDSPFSPEPCRLPMDGEYVSVVSGPLKGARGRISGTTGNYRLIASLTLLGRSVAVEIDRDWVRPMQSPSACMRNQPAEKSLPVRTGIPEMGRNNLRPELCI